MTEDLHSLSGAYALDAVDDLERARFEVHLKDCDSCRREVDSLRAAGSELALQLEIAPPALRAAVLHDIKGVRPLPPLVAEPAPAERSDRRRQAPHRLAPVRWLTAAAAAALILVGGIWHPWVQHGEPALSATQQVLQAPDAQRVVRIFSGAKATVVRSPSLGRAVIVADKMPAAPAGKVYELWLFDSRGNARKAGLMPAGDQAQVSLILDGDASTAKGAGITVEPAGGSDQPTSRPILQFPFV